MEVQEICQGLHREGTSSAPHEEDICTLVFVKHIGET